MPRSRHLVLVGGGHAHLLVLSDFARAAPPGVDLTLISPHPKATYTGMVPGVLSGQYRRPQAEIDLTRLASAAGARFLIARVRAIDAAGGWLETDGGRHGFDWLSLDIGSEPAAQHLIGAGAAAAITKPIETAVQTIESLLQRYAGSQPRFAVVGGGAGGCEIAFSIAARLRAAGGGTVTVIDNDQRPLAARHRNTSDKVLELFGRQAISFVGGVEVIGVETGRVLSAGGIPIAADAVVWATGAQGPALLRDSGLPVDERGFLRVGDDLRCAELPAIFGAGDCIALASHPKLPKAGVYAVREGPLLAANLRAALRGQPLRRYRPQAEFLSLLNTGDGKAIFSRGRHAFHGRWVWRLKDWIDRRFVARFG